MKDKIVIAWYFLTVLAIISCNTNAPHLSENQHNEYSLDKAGENRTDTARMKFLDSTTFNFGTIKAGDTVRHKFFFRNTGKQPLIISSATATCGCTIAYFNNKPIQEGQTDSIVAVFNSEKDMRGFQNKVIEVSCNAPASPLLLTMYGKIN